MNSWSVQDQSCVNSAKWVCAFAECNLLMMNRITFIEPSCELFHSLFQLSHPNQHLKKFPEDHFAVVVVWMLLLITSPLISACCKTQYSRSRTTFTCGMTSSSLMMFPIGTFTRPLVLVNTPSRHTKDQQRSQTRSHPREIPKYSVHFFTLKLGSCRPHLSIMYSMWFIVIVMSSSPKSIQQALELFWFSVFRWNSPHLTSLLRAYLVSLVAFYEIIKNLVKPWLTAHDCQPSVRFSSQDSQTQLTDSYPSR